MAETISAAKDPTNGALTEEAQEMVQDMANEGEERGDFQSWSQAERDALEKIDQRLRRELEARIRYFAERPQEIDDRLAELDREWDLERLLMANAGAFSLMGLTFGVAHRRWFLLPMAVGVFLIQHAAKGWCPPSSLLRRLGIRTAAEIDHERYALKAVRGDFDTVRTDENPEERARRAIEAADRNV
jgi:hypothetical protein